MILRTLLAHYRRHPVQAAFLLTSIVLANVLLVGTQLINAQARASYAEGERVLQSAPIAELRPGGGGRVIDERDYIGLRLQGFEMLVPVLRRTTRSAEGELLELMGIDALALQRRVVPADERTERDREETESPRNPALRAGLGFTGFSFPPYEVWASDARLRQLGKSAGTRIALSDGRLLPPLQPAAGEDLGHRLLLDIGVLQSLTDSAGELSAILVFPAERERLDALRAALPGAIEYQSEVTTSDPETLTRSFHLNLAAMGLLAFVVGVFLLYNALAFSYTDRRDLLRKLRLAGVTNAELRTALVLELIGFLLIGTLLGAWLGAQIAAWLLPGVGQTLAQLYGVYIAYPDTFAPGALWMPLAMTTMAAVACLVHPIRQALRAPLLGRVSSAWQAAATARRDRRFLLAGLGLLSLAGWAAIHAEEVLPALAGMAMLLLGAALCVPAVLRCLLAGLGRIVRPRHVRARWLLADSRWLLGPASLALIAMTLALVANSGLNTMIASFRQATDDWLEFRLAAQLYFRATPEPAALSAWLSDHAPGVILTERYRTVIDVRAPAGHGARVEIVTLHDEWSPADGVRLIRGAPDAQVRFARGEGVFISERAWRLDGWRQGDTVEVCSAVRLPVLGIYHDYGNPYSQWMINASRFASCWPQQEPASRALHGPPGTDWSALRSRLLESFDMAPGDVVDRAAVKSAGLAVFDRTFLITDALNLLTLLVAGIGVFCAVSAIHHHRVGQQALLASLGVTARERGALLLLQWGLFGFLCMIVVGPFGAALAAYLAGVVTPAAFGWSFPLELRWSHYPVLAGFASVALVLAVLLPSVRLLRTQPGIMLREEPV